MTTQPHSLCSVFAVRVTGASFDLLAPLRTPESLSVARRILGLEEAVTARILGLPSGAARKAHEKAVRAMQTLAELPVGSEAAVPELQEYGALKKELDTALHEELYAARTHLRGCAAALLPSYLVFAADSKKELRGELEKPAELHRTAKIKNDEIHLLLYLQRLVAKCDTFSEFGPHSWGRVEPGPHLWLDPGPVCRRNVFVERWAVKALAEVFNADPEVADFLCPALAPTVRLESGHAVDETTGTRTSLTAAELQVLSECDGSTPVYKLTGRAALASLLASGILTARLREVAAEKNPYGELLTQVSAWPDSSARTRALASLHSLGEQVTGFAATTDPAARRSLMERAATILSSVQAVRKAPSREIYAAANIIGENCYRETGFSVGSELVAQLVADAGPWFDLWSDTFNYVAHKVGLRLQSVLDRLPRPVLSLPAFLQACNTDGIALDRGGLRNLSAAAFGEVCAAMQEATAHREDAPEWELTREECQYVRRKYAFPLRDDCSLPSADLQLAAPSVEAMTAGQYQWIVSELHSAMPMVGGLMSWSCPWLDEVTRAVAANLAGGPVCYWGFPAPDRTVHMVTQWDRTGTRWINVTGDDPRADAPRPAECEVHVASTGDIRVRDTRTGQDLGSVVRNWGLAVGWHPFYLPLRSNNPRLRLGRVVVQRRSWTIASADLGSGKASGVSPALLLAWERLRRRLELPAHLYVRPTEDALARRGAKPRDKDVKPIYVDLDSYLSMELLAMWLNKYDRLELTEMLPAADQLLWRENDGRRMFELRTLVTNAEPVPRRTSTPNAAANK